jgi:hypothetical protein
MPYAMRAILFSSVVHRRIDGAARQSNLIVGVTE